MKGQRVLIGTLALVILLALAGFLIGLPGTVGAQPPETTRLLDFYHSGLDSSVHVVDQRGFPNEGNQQFYLPAMTDDLTITADGVALNYTLSANPTAPGLIVDVNVPSSTTLVLNSEPAVSNSPSVIPIMLTLYGQPPVIIVPCDTNALINAINTANSDDVADTLNLAAGCTYTLTEVDNDTDGPNGLPSITSAITINGNSATIQRSTAGDTPDFRVFHVAARGDLTLNNVTISNGRASTYGGGILITTSGTVTLNASVISNNYCGFLGGGIVNDGMLIVKGNSSIANNLAVDGGGIFNGFNGTLEIINSTISDNSAKFGGGIFNDNGGIATIAGNSTISGNSATGWGGGIGNVSFGNAPDFGTMLTISDSTISGNSASSGGGIFSNTGIVEVTNSTVSNNETDGSGGGIYNYDETLELTNSTVSGNRGEDGGGIYNDAGTVELTNTIVADNPSGGDCSGSITSLGHNLDSDGTCSLTATGDLPNRNPKLGPLQDNGGPTWTHALLPSSPAIDAGDDNACPATDQRGEPRPADGDGDGTATCDIGAYELQPQAIWSDVCVPHRIEITGIGMGDRHHTINPQTLSLADPDSVYWLWAQVAGRYKESAPITPDSVTFTTDAPQSVTLTEPSNDTPHGYTFETNLQPTGQITASVSHPGDGYKTPRGLILYAKRATAGEWWTSVGKTTHSYVYHDSRTEILTFPPLEEATDLFITAVVIDNDDDARPMVLEATAGGVTESVTELGPTDGDGLNVVNLTLQQVPTDTNQVSVTLRSPSEDGDSLVLVGLNVSYPCPGAILHVVPSPATIPLGVTDVLTITVTPGPAEVNGVQVHGRLDPTYLHLVDVRPTDVLPVELDRVAFDPATGEFRYGAGLLTGVLIEPFPVLVLEVQAVMTTTGTLIEFLDEFPPTDISGPEGSVMSQAQDGLVIVTLAPILRGSVDMQGRPAKPAPPWAIPLTVWLTPVGSTLPYTYTTATDQYGEFGLYLEGITLGLYDVRVKGNHTLRNLAPNVSLVSGDNPYFFDTLLEGDVETVATFNQVLQADADVLIGSFNQCQGDPDFVANADLDESGCVLLPDFGLLSGNFGKEGDIVITPTISLPPGWLQASSSSGALMAFSAEEMTVAVDEVVTLTLDIDPRGELVNGGMVHLNFDPTLVEVVEVTPTDHLPLVLAEPLVDNQQGVVRFGAGVLGQTLGEKFSLATLSLKVKQATPGTTVTLADVFPATDVSGPEGSVLAEARGVTLTTEGPVEKIFLPVIMKE